MLISPTEAGRLGIVNALVGSTVSAVGLAMQDWGRRRRRAEERGVEPSSCVSYEIRAATGAGLVCVVLGACSGVLGDALLPLSTQAPLAAFSVVLRTVFTRCLADTSHGAVGGRRRRAARALRASEKAVPCKSEPLTAVVEAALPREVSAKRESALGSLAALCDVAPHKRRALSLALMSIGPMVALVGAPLEDFGGVSFDEARALVVGPAAVTYTAISVCLLLVLQRCSQWRRASRPSASGAEGALALAYAALGSAFASAWAHSAVKAIVELFVFYREESARFFQSPTAWTIFCATPLLVALKLRFVSLGLRDFPAATFMPLFQALAVAANAVCGVFYYDDFGVVAGSAVSASRLAPFSSSTSSPLEHRAIRERGVTAMDALAYFTGVCVTLTGLLLSSTLADGSADDDPVDATCAMARSSRDDASEEEDDASEDCEELESRAERRSATDAAEVEYGAVRPQGAGDGSEEALLERGGAPLPAKKRERRDWSCGTASSFSPRLASAGGRADWESAAAAAASPSQLTSPDTIYDL